jgi:hypothetical protein
MIFHPLHKFLTWDAEEPITTAAACTQNSAIQIKKSNSQLTFKKFPRPSTGTATPAFSLLAWPATCIPHLGAASPVFRRLRFFPQPNRPRPMSTNRVRARHRCAPCPQNVIPLPLPPDRSPPSTATDAGAPRRLRTVPPEPHESQRSIRIAHARVHSRPSDIRITNT